METVAPWYQVPKDTVVLGKEDLYQAYQAEWNGDVTCQGSPWHFGGWFFRPSEHCNRGSMWMLKYLVLWMNCFLWPHAFFPGLHHAERSREKRRIRRDLSIVLPLARDWSPRLVCNFQDHFAQVHALVRMRNFAKPNQACRRAIGLRTSFVAGRSSAFLIEWFVLFLFESCRDCILSFLVVSSARTHPSLPWEFLLMRLSCNCSLRQSWKDVLFWPKDFKLSQPRRPNASSATGQGHNARVFFCAGQPWMTDFNRSNVDPGS